MLRLIAQTLRKPSAEELAQREADEAQRQLLDAQSKAEYYNHIVRYHRERIQRLRAQLANGVQ